MKMMLSLVAAVSAVSAFASRPEIAGLRVVQDKGSYDARLEFTLSKDAILLLGGVKTNGVPVEASRLGGLKPSFNRKFPGGRNSVTWNLLAAWGEKFKLENVTVDLKATDANEPPDWLVFDLAPNGDVPRFYEQAGDVPDGVDADVYKTTKLLMRRIPAKGVEWRMGACVEWAGNDYRVREIPHYVTLSEDYYLAVYEFTRGQYRTLTGSDAAEWGGFADSDKRPAAGTGISHTGLTGTLMPALSARTGGAFSLPTESQWEYACRAGCPEDLYDYTWIQTRDNADVAADALAWNKTTANQVVQAVGQKPANDWGLRDMLGNVWELCADYYSTGDAYSDGSPVIDPVGIGTDAVRRGGSVNDGNTNCRAAYRNNAAVGSTHKFWGFRPKCALSF